LFNNLLIWTISVALSLFSNFFAIVYDKFELEHVDFCLKCKFYLEFCLFKDDLDLEKDGLLIIVILFFLLKDTISLHLLFSLSKDFLSIFF